MHTIARTCTRTHAHALAHAHTHAHAHAHARTHTHTQSLSLSLALSLSVSLTHMHTVCTHHGKGSGDQFRECQPFRQASADMLAWGSPCAWSTDPSLLCLPFCRLLRRGCLADSGYPHASAVNRPVQSIWNTSVGAFLLITPSQLKSLLKSHVVPTDGQLSSGRSWQSPGTTERDGAAASCVSPRRESNGEVP